MTTGVLTSEDLVTSLASDNKVIRFYDVVFAYLNCAYSVFLDKVVPVEERAPLPDTLLDRFASGNRFEQAQIGKLLWAQLAAGNQVVFPAGSFEFISTDDDAVEVVRLALKQAPIYRSFGLVADGEFHPLPEDGRKRNALVKSLAADSENPLLLVASDDFHAISDDDERAAYKHAVTVETVSAMIGGVAAMKAGEAAPIIIGPRLPRTYVKSLDADLVGEPDLLVPIPSKATYTAVDYKDSSVLSSSTRTQKWKASPGVDPFYESAQPTDIGAGVLHKKHRLQLFHYQLMLEPLLERLGTKATPWAAIIGREGLAVWSDQTAGYWGRSASNRDSASTVYYSVVKASEEASALGELFAAGVDVELPVHLGPAKTAACAECPFRKHCEMERSRNGGHLTLHPDIGPGQALELGEVLPHPSLDDLAFADAADLANKIADGGVKGFGTDPVLIHPKVQLLIDGARAIRSNKSYRRRDQSRVPTLEAVIEVHLDLENNNNPMAGGRVAANHWFQTGFVTKKGVDDLSDKVTTRYNCRFTDGTSASEAEMFRWLWASIGRLQAEAQTRHSEIITQRGTEALARLQARDDDAVSLALQRFGVDSTVELVQHLGREALAGIVPFRIFVFSPAEHRIMRAKALEHEGVAGIPTVEEVDDLFALSTPGRPESATAVDLCAFVKTYLHLPLPDRKLKTVAPYVGHYWEVDDPNGLTATYKADEMFSFPGSEVARAAEEWSWTYNKADCGANLAVRRWIDSTPWKGVEKLDTEGVFRSRFPRRQNRRQTDPTLFDEVA